MASQVLLKEVSTGRPHTHFCRHFLWRAVAAPDVATKENQVTVLSPQHSMSYCP